MQAHVFEDTERDGDGNFEQRVKRRVENVRSNTDTYISNLIPQLIVIVVTAGSW